jgi:hypothetical protein
MIELIWINWKSSRRPEENEKPELPQILECTLPLSDSAPSQMTSEIVVEWLQLQNVKVWISFRYEKMTTMTEFSWLYSIP